MVSLGAHIGQQNLEMDEMRALWRRLDGAGLDWLSAWDHLYEAPPAGGTLPHFEAVATLAAMACETTRARIGCLVFYVGYRNPGLLAKAATTLDHLSHGRFELGLGAGWHEWEAAAFGYDFPSLGRRFDMLEEAVPLIRSLLTQERTTHDGEWFRAQDASCLPPPVQERLPLWIGGIGERRTLGLAAREADGWNAAYIPPAEFARLSGILDQRCEKLGRDPASIRRTVNLVFLLGSSEADLKANWGELAERVMGGALLGGAEQATAKVLEYVEAGADGVNVALRAPWPPDALDAYVEEVVPAVRSAVGR